MAMNLGTDGLVIFQEQDGHRMTYHPGSDLSEASPDVVSLAAQLWMPEAVAQWRQEYQGEPAPTPTNWPALVAAIQSDEDFNAVWAAANVIKPMLAASLLVAFGNVATGGLETFAALYDAVCALGGATAEQRHAWAALAEHHHAPPEFVDVVRG